jgi:hypothetical protein
MKHALHVLEIKFCHSTFFYGKSSFPPSNVFSILYACLESSCAQSPSKLLTYNASDLQAYEYNPSRVEATESTVQS